MKIPPLNASARPDILIPLAFFLIFGWGSADAQPPANRTQSGANPPIQRDPTIPSAEIQRRTRVRPPAAPLTRSPRSVSGPIRVSPRTTSQSTLLLQSLVQSSDDSCTATIRSGEQTVTVSFVRGQPQREVELPATQFADFASTVQQLSAELRLLRTQMSQDKDPLDLEQPQESSAAPADPAESESSPEAGEAPLADEADLARAVAAAEAELLEVEREFMRQAMQPQRIDLASSFSIGGVLYRIIDFNSNTLLLEQVPLGRYVILR